MASTAISGRVLGRDGRPIGGANVYFIEGPVSLPDIAQVTGPDGAFALAAPTPGWYTLGVNVEGIPAYEEPVEVSSGAPRSITIRLGVKR